MHPIWKIDEDTISRWREFVKENSNNDAVINRQERNIKRKGIDLSKQNLWHVLVGCQVTTQQRSGPDTFVSRFLQSKSAALDYEKCKQSTNLIKLLEDEFTQASLKRKKGPGLIYFVA